MKELIPWLWILAIALVFWLLIIRPAQRRQAQTVKLQKSIELGDDIVLTSGIYGTIVEETDDHLGVEVADGVVLRVMRGAIASKVHREDPSEDDSATDEDDDSTHTTDEAGTADVVDGED